MSNEIKPVAWLCVEKGGKICDATNNSRSRDSYALCGRDIINLYDQSPIDRLTAELAEARSERNILADTLKARTERLATERDAAVADAERLRELLRVTASVAIVQLFDAAPADVEAQFSMDELQQVVKVTSPLRDLGVSVESQYRIAIDAARKGVEG